MVHLEKLVVTQLIMKFTAFYWNWMFITVFTRSHHVLLSWASWIQSMLS